MSSPISNVMGRIGQIRNRFESVRPTEKESFSLALKRAESQPVKRDGSTTEAAAPAAASPRALGTGPVSTGTLIGMLGTPIRLRPGASIGATYSAPVGPVGDWAEALPQRGREWAPAIEAAAMEANVDPRLLAALVWQESGFVPDAVSRSGAIGLSQLMPATAQGLGVDPHDPVQNLDGGARYLAWTLAEFGSLELGLAAYNAGPGNVRRAGNRIPNIPETQAYVPKVIGYYRRLGGHA